MTIGEFNVTVGNEKVSGVNCGYGLDERNDRCEQLIACADSHDMIIYNTWFKHFPRCLRSWKIPGDKVRNQTDYLLLSKPFKRSLSGAKT